MRISIKPLVAVAVILFAAEPIVFAQNDLTTQNSTDISGNWTLEIGKCKGSIMVGPAKHNATKGTSWDGIYTARCGDDNSTWEEKFYIWINSEGDYFFSGVGTYNGQNVPEGFNLHWKDDGKTLVGSSSFPLPLTPDLPLKSVAMYK
ncbi:MAG: hypothetical protein ACLQDM_27705 [Bradyrhizobium sp.]